MHSRSPAGPDDTNASTVASDGRRSLHARAAQAAQGFLAAALGPDATVALLLRNSLASLEASLAAARAGLAAVPVDPDLAPDTIGFILRDCDARILVGHADLIDRVAAALPPGLVILVAPPVDGPATADGAAGTPIGRQDWDSFVAAHPPLATPAPQTPPAVIYTSGSTGRPKAVRRAAAAVGPPSARALAVYGLDKPGPATVLITGPLHHSVPNALARTALAVGADLVLSPRFEPEALLALVAHHRVTHMHVVPSLMARWLQLPAAVRARHDVSALRHVVHGAAHCPPALKRACIDWWGPVVHEYYGSTETGLLTLHDSAEALAKPGTVGRALPGITLHVLDPDGRPLPPGASGRIYAGSASLHRFTYPGRDAERAAVGRGTLVTAGDIGFLDPDGFLFLQDRARDVVDLDGTPVYPSRIEAVAREVPGVADCAAFGCPDAAGRPGLCLCVEPGRDGVDVAALARHVEDALPHLRGRVRVERVATLPRQDSGKIVKDRLRAQFCVP